MKGRKILSRIAFSYWLLALFPSFLLILLLPPFGDKYLLNIEHSRYKPFQMMYADLNGDSITELLRLEPGRPYNHISVHDNNQHYYDEWNFPDSLDNIVSKMFVGNYDHDLYEEIYVFTIHKDSLFLNVNEFFDPSGLVESHIFITKISVVDNVCTSTLYPAGFFDENNDGKDEVYFCLATGFGLEPRHLYSFDLVNRKLKASEFTGFMLLSPEMEDMDGDHRPEIFGMASASGNYKTKTPYPDYSSWLMVFDDKLRFKFKPIEFPGFASGIHTFSYHKGNKKKFFVFYNSSNADTIHRKSRLMMFSVHGELEDSKLMNAFGNENSYAIKLMHQKEEDRIVVISRRILVLDDKFEVIHSTELPYDFDPNLIVTDLDGDRSDELIVYSADEEKLFVYNSSLSKLSEKIIRLPSAEWNISVLEDKNHVHKICISTNGASYLLSLSRNPYYLLSLLGYPGIYFLFLVFILLIRRISTYQLAQRENLKRRLISLQLQSIKAQLDPHFTFNALNSIAALIYADDRQSAYDHMNKFTQLLRRMLNDADKIYRSLKEELEFVQSYLDLEQLRFGEKLSYHITISEGITQNEQVPKMVLQTFAENAIKHGIMPSSKGGELIIKAEQENDYLKLTIEDDGIGRVKAAGLSTSTGKGLKITNEFYEILNQINERQIRHHITDLYNANGEASGTRVEVWVPLEI